MDFEGGARVAGHGFYFLKNEAVLLELALQRYALEVLLAEGFTPMTTPDLARNEVLEGIGFIPRGPETQIYSIDQSDLSLVATAEITLGGLLAGQTIEAERLAAEVLRYQPLFPHRGRGPRPGHPRPVPRPPVHQDRDVRLHAAGGQRRHAGLSPRPGVPAVRRPGRALSRGRYGHGRLGRAGLSQVRPGGLDARPRRAGEFGEVTSTSNCTDYQARRLNIRYKVKGEKGTHLVHTLNGTAIAVSRALIAILENHQQADGSVMIPEVLRGFVGKDRIVARGGGKE